MRQARDGVIIASLRIFRDVIITRSRLRESEMVRARELAKRRETARCEGGERGKRTNGRANETRTKGQRELNSSSRVPFETGSRVDVRFLVTLGPLVRILARRSLPSNVFFELCCRPANVVHWRSRESSFRVRAFLFLATSSSVRRIYSD